MSIIERIRCGNGNVFIISDGENAILVDTYREQSKDMIVEKCKDKNIRLIVLTHGHIDHIGGAAFLSKALNAPIAMHEADYSFVKDNRFEQMFAHTLLGKIILKLSEKSFKEDKTDPFPVERFLKDGDSLHEYGISATIIGLPGHTKGSIGIIIDDADVIVGDALMNIISPVKAAIYGDKAIMEQSAAKISTLGNVTVHFGHGKPVKNRKW